MPAGVGPLDGVVGIGPEVLLQLGHLHIAHGQRGEVNKPQSEILNCQGAKNAKTEMA
jgi:hypothetical protein